MGIDIINIGCALAVAMEAGVLSFSDVAAALELVRHIGRGTDIGMLIGNGFVAIGKNHDASRASVVKKPVHRWL